MLVRTVGQTTGYFCLLKAHLCLMLATETEPEFFVRFISGLRPLIMLYAPVDYQQC